MKSNNTPNKKLYTKANFSITLAFTYVLFLSSIGQIASDLYLPSLPAIQLSLGGSINYIQLSVACYMYGYGSMQIIYGPLSDAYGRRLPLLLGLIIMFIGTMYCADANTPDALLIGRILQGIGGASCNAIYKAAMRDLFPTSMLAKVSSIFSVLTVLMIASAPLLGGFIQEYYGWRYNFSILGFIIIIVFILVGITPETNRYHNKSHINPQQIINNFKMLLTNRVYLTASTCNLLCYGGLLCWLTVGPVLIMTIHNKSAVEFGYLSATVGLAFALGGTINSFIINNNNIINLMRNGFLAMLLSGGVLLASMQINDCCNLIISMVILFSFGSSFVVPNAMTLCLQPFKKIAGLAGALLGFMKNLGGALISSIIAFAPDDNQLPLAIAYILIAGSGLLMIIIAFKQIKR